MKIYVAGHNGMVGSAVVRALESFGHNNIVTKSRQQLDLTRQVAVEDFFKQEKPEYIVMAAGKVGGILANSTYPGDFIRENLLMITNTIESARKFGCTRFCFLGSSCIYPKLASQPLKEEYLLTSELEKTNIGYAIAKISGVQMIKSYREQYNFPGYSLMPTNLYGPRDNFSLTSSHVLPAMIRKFYEAKLNNKENVELFGTGTPRREFMHCDDLAGAILHTLFMKDLPEDLINVGVGEDVSISELAELIKNCVGYQGQIKYDRSKPDGTPRKLLDVSKISALGFKAKIGLKEGIKETFEWYKQNLNNLRE